MSCINMFVFVLQMDLSMQSIDVSAVEEEAQFECECGYSTKKRYNFKRHTKTHVAFSPAQTSTPKKEEVSPTQTSAPQKEKVSVVCEHCGSMFKTKYGLKLHVKNKHEMSFKHTCRLCGKGYNQTQQYRSHCSQHLNTAIQQCPDSKVEFFSHNSLKRHQQICTANNERLHGFHCHLCVATFPINERLQEHIKGKHQEARYVCSKCGKRYGWRSSLQAHFNTHNQA